MDSIPLITSLSDTRNILSLLPYTLVAGLLFPLLPSLLSAFSLTKITSSPPHNSSNTSPLPSASTTIFALALTILPFLPATNLFFYVGFVIAERLLYLPSMGFCLLAALGLHKFATFQPNLTRISFIMLLVVSSIKTVIRNGDWASEEALFTSGLSINPAKSLSNLGTVLHNQGKLGLAEAAFTEALEQRGNMADTHYNLGILLQGQGRLAEAEHAYKAAIRYDQGSGVHFIEKNLGYFMCNTKKFHISSPGSAPSWLRPT
jgi:tetratricopeptide (TPR) repeat protein